MSSGKQLSKSIGAIGEEFVVWLCEQPFARDFVFVQPMYVRGNQSKELCDVLILFEDTVIIVQVKTPDANAHEGWTDQQEAEWANKRIEEAIKQTDGAFKAILKGLIKEVRNDRQGVVRLSADTLKKFHGLAIVHHPPLDRFGKPPVLTFSGQTCSVLIATISELRSIFEELTTIGDFVDYMEARDRFFEKNAMLGITELDILAAYKHDPERFKDAVERTDTLVLESGLWEQFCANDQRVARDNANVPSRIVDAMIDFLHEQPKAELPHFAELRQKLRGVPPATSNYVEIANELARIRRVDRRMVGRKLIEKSEKCLAQKCERYFVTHPRKDPDSAILFLISTEPRDERCRSLLALMLAAKLKLKVRRIAGIVTEPVGLPEHSIDAIKIEHDPALEDTEATRQLGEDVDKLFGKSVDNDEYEFPQ